LEWPTVAREVSAERRTVERRVRVARCLPTEILTADDASNDDTVDWLRESFLMVRCESATQRRGFAPTVNRGVRVRIAAREV
jgi:hypothetical protein